MHQFPGGVDAMRRSPIAPALRKREGVTVATRARELTNSFRRARDLRVRVPGRAGRRLLYAIAEHVILLRAFPVLAPRLRRAQRLTPRTPRPWREGLSVMLGCGYAALRGMRRLESPRDNAALFLAVREVDDSHFVGANRFERAMDGGQRVAAGNERCEPSAEIRSRRTFRDHATHESDFAARAPQFTALPAEIEHGHLARNAAQVL